MLVLVLALGDEGDIRRRPKVNFGAEISIILNVGEGRYLRGENRAFPLSILFFFFITFIDGTIKLFS